MHLILVSSSATRANPRELHATIHVDLDDRTAPEGVATVWDDTEGEENEHVKIGSGRPNAAGDLVITFPAAFRFSRGAVYAEFVPDDPDRMNTNASQTERYSITDR